MASLLLSPRDLHRALAAAAHNVRILDATWFMPNVPRNPRTEFAQAHLPNALFWDLDHIASPSPLGLKHMMPAAPRFQAACNKLGIRSYDTHGLFSAPRALFTFRALGHSASSVLNGGLPAWREAGYELETGEEISPLSAPDPPYPDCSLDPNFVAAYERMVASIGCGQARSDIVLDARSRGRWLGEEPEPRPGLPSGHIPDSFSLPFPSLLKPTAGYSRLLEPSELRAVLEKALGNQAESVLSGKIPVVSTCGSGMSAAIIWLALQTLGLQTAIYDESWAGYAARPQSLIARGDARSL